MPHIHLNIKEDIDADDISTCVGGKKPHSLKLKVLSIVLKSD